MLASSFSIKKLPKVARYLIHYFVLAVSFFVIFLTVKKSGGSNEFSIGTVFAALIIFTVVYFLVLLIAKLIKRWSNSSEKAVKTCKKSDGDKYVSRFK